MANRGTGAQNEFVGGAKETFGNVTGSTQYQAEGKAQKLGGQAEQETAKTQNRAEAAGEGITGYVKQVFGAVTGNDKKEAEGRADRTKADVKSNLNQ